MKNRKLKTNRILVGDAKTVLSAFPSESIDLTITSPPYNKRNKTQGWLVTNKKYSHFDDHLPEGDYQEWQVEVLNELFRVTKPGGSLFYNHKLRWDDGLMIHPMSWLSRTLWTIKQEIVWDRGLAANMRGWRYWQVDERVYWLYRPCDGDQIGRELESKHAKLSSIWRIRPEPRKETHPAPFPIELPTRLIHSVLKKPGSIVLDPFCGTGTTLVAARLLEHSFVGIDVSPEYADIARLRLKKADAEQPRVTAEMRRHSIDDPFKNRKERGTVSWPFGPTNAIGDGHGAKPSRPVKH